MGKLSLYYMNTFYKTLGPKCIYKNKLQPNYNLTMLPMLSCQISSRDSNKSAFP